jgi:prepilin-type N-terminal cleavage/methylation domain-containing protein
MRPLRTDDSGFTFIEIMVVLAVMSIMALAVAPRMTNFFKNERENSAILTGLIARTFDDSFLNDRINYLAIHLYDPGDEANETADKTLKDIYSRRNAVSVLRLEDGTFRDNRRRILESRSFADFIPPAGSHPLLRGDREKGHRDNPLLSQGLFR